MRNLSDMFLALRDFDSKEDKIEVEYHNYNLVLDDFSHVCK